MAWQKSNSKRYSHSKLSTFEQCPLKFKFKYIDKIPVEFEKTIESHLGSVVHNVLEWIYNEVKNNPELKIKLDDIIIYYSDNWKQEYTDDILINDDLTEEDYFNKGIQFLADYFTKHSPFRDGTIEVEKKILFSLDENGNYEIIGFIDRLAQNIHTGEFEIHDYKTGNFLPSQEKLDNDRQLALYAIAIKQIYGKDKEVTLNWHYLAHNKKVISKRTNEQLSNLKKQTLELIKKIETTNNFPAKISQLCKWCEYKNQCSAIKKMQNPNPSESKQENISDYPTIRKYIRD